MNIDNNESPDITDADGPADAVPAAPKRRPRARKTVETGAADSSAAAATAEPVAAEPAASAPAEAEPAAELAAKPARAPRKPRATKPKAEPALEPGGDATAAEAAALEAAPPVAAAQAAAADLPVTRGESAAPQVAWAEPAAQDEAGEREPSAAGEPDEGESAQAGEAGAQAGQGEGGAAGESRRERSRNRRRGRRGGARSEGEGEAEGSQTAEAEGGSDRAPVPAAEAAVPTLPAPDTSEVFASLLSGDFDADQGAEEEVAEPEVDDKRVLAPDPDAPKLHKVLAQSGIGSRRDMEQMIQDGRVSVNGETAHVGMRISFGDRVAIDGKPAKVRIAPPPPRIIAYHKPTGEVVTHDDPQQRPTVFRRLPRLPQGKWQSVGRLDINTEGLLLFTNSGDLANKLMHPRFGIEREYAVRVLGTLEKEARAQLLAGVNIEGQVANFKSIEDGGGEGVNRWYRVVISEGRNREVRKLFDAVGLTVSRLIRVRYGCVVLPRGLKRGVWVDLDEGDVRALRVLTGVQPQSQQQQRPDPRSEPRRDGKSGARPPQGPAPKRGNEPRGPVANERSDRGGKPRDDRRDDRRGGPRPAHPPAAAGDSLPREFREPGDPTRIPNPLQQTFDKRAMQRERSPSREDLYENGPIPNPLQQTYDKRFVQGQRGGGFGNPNQPHGGGKGGKGGGNPANPDPLQTAVGYIGADAFTRKSQGRGNNRGGRRGGR